MFESPRETLPLACIDQSSGSASFGVVCEGCPLAPTEVGCIALQASETIIRLTEENERRESENAILLDRLFNLRLDALVDTVFTPEGMRDHLQHDEEIQEELGRMQWGVIRLDGRFVNYINRFGTDIGDDFLQSGGQEITAISDGLVRVRERRNEQEPAVAASEDREAQRRQGHSMTLDVICRQGGDEFALLIRNVDPARLALVAARVQGQLTVTNALNRYDTGKVPFIASVGYAHATDFTPEVTGLLSRNDYWQAFRKISGRADTGQREIKAQQYDEMWNIAVRSMPAEQRPITVTRPGDREVAETFLRTMCPDFMRNPLPFLVRQNQLPQPDSNA